MVTRPEDHAAAAPTTEPSSAIGRPTTEPGSITGRPTTDPSSITGRPTTDPGPATGRPTPTPNLPTVPSPDTGSARPRPGVPAADGPKPLASGTVELPEVSAGFIWLLVLGTFGVHLAYIVPLVYSLAIRIDQLAPAHQEYLGYVTGIGSVVTLLTTPLLGVLSDRTRARLGRRRPYLIAGALLGLVSLVIVAFAPTMVVLALGWVLSALGWLTAINAINNVQADRLPIHQRGRVAGLTGFAQQVSPVLGVALSGLVKGDNLVLLLLPGVAGVLLAAPLMLRRRDADTRSAAVADRLSLGLAFRKYFYRPSRYPDFSWNWLGRFCFFTGVTFTSTFLTFFFAQRLGLDVKQVAPAIALVGGAGAVATTLGAIGGGFLSDKLRRRRLFVLAAAIVFAVGAVLTAFASTLPLLVVGFLVIDLGLGTFSAVDQALTLDVLPHRGTDAGRFVGIMTLAMGIPSAIAPLIASGILAIGATASTKDYTLLYLVGGALTVVGGLVIVLRVRGTR